MIIINKKNIIFTTGIVAIFIFAYIITGYNVNKIKTNESNLKAIQTVALPVNNKVIVLDARASELQMNGAESSMRNNRGRK